MTDRTQTANFIPTPYILPPVGDNPSTNKEGTTPGSFANKNRVGTAYAFSSPDTPGMPEVSDKTAWDFLPDGWRVRTMPADTKLDTFTPAPCFIGDHPSVTFRTAYDDILGSVVPAKLFSRSRSWSSRGWGISPRRCGASPSASRICHARAGSR